MSRQTTIANTPHYVLVEGQRRIGPLIVRGPTDCEYDPIYGFSNKSRYDLFCQNNPTALAPYPLVEAFLQSQANIPGDCLRLIVLDASGPDDACIHAATVADVLGARRAKSQQVQADFQLQFDPSESSYQVRAARA